MKKRILFVDDDPVLLELYEIIMHSESERWAVTTAVEPRTALELLGREPFDVLVSDFRMPGMDGLQFMREVCQRYPRAARITVSGQGDQAELARCLGSTHQFLPKPFDCKLFKSTLARVSELHGFLQSPQLQSIVSKLGTLPSFPSLYLEMLSEINREDGSLETLAEIVAKDPGMTAKLLQVVNSAAFGRARKMSAPIEALQYLGVATVRALVLSAHVFSSLDDKPLKGLSMKALWEHAVQTASLARCILQSHGCEPEEAEEGYTAGLLHDIGKLMLAHSLPDQYEAVLQMAEESGISLAEAEAQIFGATHAGVGAYLLGLWGLPSSIVEAVAFHHSPSFSNLRIVTPLTAVHVANNLVVPSAGTESAPPAASLDMEYLTAVGVHDRIEAWRTRVSQGPIR